MAKQQLERAFTIVSPDAVDTGTDTDTDTDTEQVSVDGQTTTTKNGKRIVVIPMAEWFQCLQRAVRTWIQAFIFMIGGGTIYQILTGLGIPPASAENLPSTGYAVYDAILYSLVLAIVVFIWNACEFALDIDIKAPRWRA